MPERRTFARMVGFFGGFLGPDRGKYIAALAAIGLTNYGINLGFSLAAAQITASMVDRDQAALVHALVGLVAIGLCAVVIFYAAGVALVRGAARAEASLRLAVFRKVICLPLATAGAQSSGDLLSRMNTDVVRSAALYRQGLQNLSIVVLNGIGSIATALIFDLRAGLLVLGLSSVMLLLTLPLTRPLGAASRSVQEAEASVLSAFGQLLQGASVIRYFHLASWITGRVRVRTQALARAGVRLTMLEALRASTDAIDFGITIGVVIYGGRRCLDDPSFAPTLIALIQISSGISVLFAQVGGLVADVRIRLAAAERVVEVLDLADEPVRLTAPPLLPGSPEPSRRLPGGPAPGLVIDGLSFTYRDTVAASVHDVSLHVPPGQRAALVGPSGGGKTTILKLVLGLYAPATGSVWINGRSIHEDELAAWRGRCAYVPQDPFLFAGTVHDNLVAGGSDPGAEAVTRAAQMANAHDFIAALPQGYHTPLGEGAKQLSGGQRQRLAIARAILQDAPVLLLDEPSSSIDRENERDIHEALRRLMRDRATLMIAHRLSTIRDADCIHYVEAGRVVEQGTHDALMRIPAGKYRRLVEAEHDPSRLDAQPSESSDTEV